MLLGPSFYDKYGNFDNTKFLKLLEKAKKEKFKKSRGSLGGSKSIEISLFNSVSSKELWGFINKLSIFMNSGIDIKGALGIIVKQIKNPYLGGIVSEIKENIDHGVGVSETMTQYPKVFDNLIVSLINVGEKTGQLGLILNELDASLLENIELKGKVKGAMIYPMILFSLTILMVVFMMVFIIPRITEGFNKAGAELPALTQFVVGISDFLITKWYILIIIITIIVVIVKAVNRSYYGKIFFSKMAIRMPIFGYIVKQSNIVYFIKSFVLLQNSGVLLLDSLNTSSRVVTNLMYKKELIRIKNEVEVGLTISKALGLNLEYESSIYVNNLFSEEFAYVVSTGEETGSLSASLEKIGKNYNGELKRYIGNLSSMMEPVIIVIVGFLVGTIVVAIMMPFFELGNVAENL